MAKVNIVDLLYNQKKPVEVEGINGSFEIEGSLTVGANMEVDGNLTVNGHTISDIAGLVVDELPATATEGEIKILKRTHQETFQPTSYSDLVVGKTYNFTLPIGFSLYALQLPYKNIRGEVKDIVTDYEIEENSFPTQGITVETGPSLYFVIRGENQGVFRFNPVLTDGFTLEHSISGKIKYSSYLDTGPGDNVDWYQYLTEISIIVDGYDLYVYKNGGWVKVEDELPKRPAFNANKTYHLGLKPNTAGTAWVTDWIEDE